MEEFTQVVALQIRIWKKQLQDVVSAFILQSVSHNGGAVIGAEIEGQMVGFSFCFPAYRPDYVTLWSHISGVLPAYQNRGIGFLLKQKQRQWALENGHTAIAWTFDPLQRGNANFNFNRLGVTASTYHVNLYGEMKDRINIGLATDRLEAVWNLHASKVVALSEGTILEASPEVMPKEFYLVTVSGDTIHSQRPAPLDQPAYGIEIPWNLPQLKQHDLLRTTHWQQAVRSAMLYAFEQQYMLSDFVQHEGRCWYVVFASNEGLNQHD